MRFIFILLVHFLITASSNVHKTESKKYYCILCPRLEITKMLIQLVISLHFYTVQNISNIQTGGHWNNEREMVKDIYYSYFFNLI